MKKVLTLALTIVMLMTMSFTAMAAESDFVPSIEIKPGPGIVEDPAESGNGGVIIMPDGTEVIVPISEIIVTPISKADDAADHIKNALNDAFGDVSGVSSLDQLISNLQNLIGDIDVADVVIKDLFHVDVTGDYVEYLQNGGKLTITFDVSSNIPVALTKLDGVWSAMSGDAMKINDNGTITLTIGSVGVYAFLKDVAKVDVDPENPGVSSPTTGDATPLYVISAVAFFVLAAFLMMMAKKQKV